MTLKPVDLLMRNVPNRKGRVFQSGPITRGRQNMNFRFRNNINFEKIDEEVQLFKFFARRIEHFCPMEIQKLISRGKEKVRLSRPSVKMYRE